MPDTYKTTYRVEKEKQFTLEGKQVNVAGFVSSCDYCEPCHDEAEGIDSLSVWENGETTIRFFPHVTDQNGPDYTARSTELINSVGTIPRTSFAYGIGVDGLADPSIANPDWVDGGGFYFKKRTPAFLVSSDPPTNDPNIDEDGNHLRDVHGDLVEPRKPICEYLIEVNWSAVMDNQILNWFRGGPDRMAFLVVNRHTDRMAENNVFPSQPFVYSEGIHANPDLKGGIIQQYFHFLNHTGSVGASGITGDGIERAYPSGKFFFKAKSYDSFWIEFYEYGRRGFSNEELMARESNENDENMFRVEYAEMNDATSWGLEAPETYGPGLATAVVNWSKSLNDYDSFYDFSLGYTTSQRIDLGVIHKMKDDVKNYNDTLPELRRMGAFARYNRGVFEGGNVFYDVIDPETGEIVVDEETGENVVNEISDSELKYNRLGADGTDNPLSGGTYNMKYELPATLGSHSAYDLNLGLADPINYDWRRGDPETLNTNESTNIDHNNIKMTFKKHLIVSPSFAYVPSEDASKSLTNKTVAFAPYMEIKSFGFLGHGRAGLNHPLGDIDSDHDVKVGGAAYPHGSTEGNRFTKNMGDGKQAPTNKVARPGQLLHHTLAVEK